MEMGPVVESAPHYVECYSMNGENQPLATNQLFEVLQDFKKNLFFKRNHGIYLKLIKES